MSDHCPMILDCHLLHKKFSGFRFESCWLQYPDFKDIVKQSWAMPVAGNNKARIMYIKLSRLAKALKQWHRKKMADIRKETLLAQQQVLQLDKIQDERQLTEAEFFQRKEAKHRIVATAGVRKIRLRQHLRLTWIRVGDANTKLFHLSATARQRRNFIPSLQHDGMNCITHEAKSAALKDFFSKQFGSGSVREHTVNWEQLRPIHHNLQDLDRNVTDEESIGTGWIHQGLL
jgi:hypothetical protein